MSSFEVWRGACEAGFEWTRRSRRSRHQIDRSVDCLGIPWTLAYPSPRNKPLRRRPVPSRLACRRRVPPPRGRLSGSKLCWPRYSRSRTRLRLRSQQIPQWGRSPKPSRARDNPSGPMHRETTISGWLRSLAALQRMPPSKLR